MCASYFQSMVRLYHVSPADKGLSIVSNGLVSDDAIFAWGSLEYARTMAEDVAEQFGDALIWEIDPAGTPWYPDPNYPDGWAFYALDPIPADRVKRVSDAEVAI